MNNNTRIVLFFVVWLSLLVACSPDRQANAASPGEVSGGQRLAANAAGDTVSGTVLETMDAGGYTYVHLDTGDKKIWAAGPRTVIKPGSTATVSLQMPMSKFHSKALNRDFDVLYFVGQIATHNVAPNAAPDAAIVKPHAGIANDAPDAPEQGIKKVKGGKTVAEILDQKQALAGKSVRVRGKVVKSTSEVLNTNWLHIRDSSSTADLTVTTKGNAKVGDLVVANGTVVLDKDFGYGYTYEVLLQDAALTVE